MIFINLDNYARNLNYIYMHIVLRPTEQNLNSAILIGPTYKLFKIFYWISYNEQNYSHTCNLFNKSAFQNTMQTTSDINLLLHFLLLPT